jgi:hypothetical protein
MKKTVTSVRETVKLSPKGTLDRWKVVEYMLDDYGPFLIEMPVEQFSWDKVKEEMVREEAGLKSVIG